MTQALPTRGRPRDAAIDGAVLAVTRRLLAERGVEGFGLDEVARGAGTSRQAIYRRWPNRRVLADAALRSLADADTAARDAAARPFDDLVAELEDFRRAIGGTGRLSLVGTMLQSATDPELMRRYQETVIAPRRRRLRGIIERAVEAGELARDADVEVAVTMLTGSWYARCLAGEPEPPGWARRIAVLAWTALGGSPPVGAG